MSYSDLVGGFSVISQHLLDNKVVVESLLVFWKEYTNIEETYAKSLRELLGSPAAGLKSSTLHRFASFFNEDSKFDEGGTLKNGWQQIKDGIERVAGFHTSLSSSLKKEVVSKLETYLSESESKKKQVIGRGKSALSDIKKVQTNLEKEKEKYLKLVKEVESLMKSVNDTLSAAKNTKVQAQIAGMKKDVETCTVKYKSYVEEHRTLHNQYYLKQQPHILKEMQVIESERIGVIKLSLQQYRELFADLIPILESEDEKIKKELDNISADTDVGEFVEKHKAQLGAGPSLPSAEPGGDLELPSSPPNKPTQADSKPAHSAGHSGEPDENVPPEDVVENKEAADKVEPKVESKLESKIKSAMAESKQREAKEREDSARVKGKPGLPKHEQSAHKHNDSDDEDDVDKFDRAPIDFDVDEASTSLHPLQPPKRVSDSAESRTRRRTYTAPAQPSQLEPPEMEEKANHKSEPKSQAAEVETMDASKTKGSNSSTYSIKNNKTGKSAPTKVSTDNGDTKNTTHELENKRSSVQLNHTQETVKAADNNDQPKEQIAEKKLPTRIIKPNRNSKQLSATDVAEITPEEPPENSAIARDSKPTTDLTNKPTKETVATKQLTKSQEQPTTKPRDNEQEAAEKARNSKQIKPPQEEANASVEQAPSEPKQPTPQVSTTPTNTPTNNATNNATDVSTNNTSNNPTNNTNNDTNTSKPYNRFSYSTSTFKTNNAISARIDRFNQSNTTFKKDEIPLQNKSEIPSQNKSTTDLPKPTTARVLPKTPSYQESPTFRRNEAVKREPERSSAPPRAREEEKKLEEINTKASMPVSASPIPPYSRAPVVKRDEIPQKMDKPIPKAEIPTPKPTPRTEVIRSKEEPPLSRHSTEKREQSEEIKPKASMPVTASPISSPSRAPLVRHKSVPVMRPPPEPEEEDEKSNDPSEILLSALVRTAEANDLYDLFGISSEASQDDIGKRRRQLTQQLHPDNFEKDSDAWHDAQKRMARVNQAYNNVLRKEATRSLYEKIVVYRGSYRKLLFKSDGVLQNAANNLYALRESLRSSNMPHFLVEELDQGLGMLREIRGIRPEL